MVRVFLNICAPPYVIVRAARTRSCCAFERNAPKQAENEKERMKKRKLQISKEVFCKCIVATVRVPPITLAHCRFEASSTLPGLRLLGRRACIMVDPIMSIAGLHST